MQNELSSKQDTLTAGTGIDITNNVISNTQTSAEWGNITGTLADQTDLNTALGNKQDTLVSGTNIKTINNESVLGSGNISVGGNEIYIGDEQDAPATTKLVIENPQAEWDGLPISNTYNTNTNNTYSCDYINTKANTYTTTEQRVGTWIDGKPLYRRVINNILVASANIITITLNYNIDAIMLRYAEVLISDNHVVIPRVFSNNTHVWILDVKSSQIIIENSSSYSGTGLLIIEYTKTTD